MTCEDKDVSYGKSSSLLWFRKCDKPYVSILVKEVKSAKTIKL